MISGSVKAEDEAEVETPKVDEDVGKSRDGSKTDDEVVQREEEAINIDGLSVAEMKQMRESSEKHAFQAEVSRMMKLIINSLYKNKEVGKIIFSHVWINGFSDYLLVSCLIVIEVIKQLVPNYYLSVFQFLIMQLVFKFKASVTPLFKK